MPLQDFSSITPDPSIGVVLFCFQMHCKDHSISVLYGIWHAIVNALYAVGYRMMAKAYNYLATNPGCRLILTNDDQTILIPGGVCPGKLRQNPQCRTS